MLLYKICHQFLDRYKSKSLVGKELRMERSCWLAFHRCTATLYYILKSVILSHDTTFYSSFFLRFSQSTNVIFSFLCFFSRKYECKASFSLVLAQRLLAP